MGPTPPLVSVLVNTFNHERFIGQALRSALKQDFPSIEIIVVDDGSTDGTGKIARSFSPYIRYILKTNGGQVSTLQAAVTEIQGEIVAFLDGDDWWTSNKISSVVDAFTRYPQAAAVGHGFDEVDESGTRLRTMVPDSEYFLSFKTPECARFSANLRVFGGTSRMAMRRSALNRALPVPGDLPFFDNFMFTQAIALSGAVLIPQSLTYYRLHGGNLYATTSNDRQIIRRKYVLQRGLLRHLPPRLSALGVPKEIVNAALECDRVYTDRLALAMEGGKRWDTFRVERADFRVAYRDPSFTYRLFKGVVLLLTLLIPPKRFYGLRDWYTRSRVRSFRQLFGTAKSVVTAGIRVSSER